MRFDALVAFVLAVGTLGLALFILGPTLQRALSTSTFHYCRHCGLRLVYWDASDDDTHVFVRDYLAWVARGDKDQLLAVKSPLGPPPDAAALSTLALGDSVPPPGHAKSCVTVEASSVRLTIGPMGPVPYDPKGPGYDEWRIDGPHMRVYLLQGKRAEARGGCHEAARVRVWRTKTKAAVYLRGGDGEVSPPQDGDWETAASSYPLEPLSGVGVDVDSSMGPLFWTRRVSVDDGQSPAKPVERAVLLDAYDRVLAIEAPTETPQACPSLQIYGDLPDRFVEEIQISWVVQQMQVGRIADYYWNEAVKYM